MRVLKQVLIVFSAVFCLFVGVSTAQAAVRLTGSETSLLRAVNAVRAQHGLARLRVDTNLQRAARYQTSRMLRTGVFAHGNFAWRMTRFHVRGPAMGENLAWGTGAAAQPQSFIGMWLNSPSHRANLLRPGYRRIGIGALVGSFAGAASATVVTTDFAGR